MTIDKYFERPDQQPSKSDLDSKIQIDTEKQIINQNLNDPIFNKNNLIYNPNETKIINMLTKEIIDTTTLFFKIWSSKFRPFIFFRNLMVPIVLFGTLYTMLLNPQKKEYWNRFNFPSYQITIDNPIYKKLPPNKLDNIPLNNTNIKYNTQPNNLITTQDNKDNLPKNLLSKEDKQILANSLHDFLNEYKYLIQKDNTFEIGFETRIGLETNLIFNQKPLIIQKTPSNDSSIASNSNSQINYSNERIILNTGDQFDAITSTNIPNNSIHFSQPPIKPVFFIGIYFRKPFFKI
jgi:hypothetical protein